MSLIRDFWTAMNGNDWNAVAQAFLAEDFLGIWPQTNEMIHGRDEFVRVNAAFPGQGGWLFEVMRVVTEGDHAASDVRVTQPDLHVTARALTFHDIVDGRIIRQVEYWPEPNPVPEWRSGMLTRDADLARF